MLLVKCKCGCHFTLSNDWVQKIRKNPTCPNCLECIPFDPHAEVCNTQTGLEQAGATVSAVPDDAKFTVTFDA